MKVMPENRSKRAPKANGSSFSKPASDGGTTSSLTFPATYEGHPPRLSDDDSSTEDEEERIKFQQQLKGIQEMEKRHQQQQRQQHHVQKMEHLQQQQRQQKDQQQQNQPFQQHQHGTQKMAHTQHVQNVQHGNDLQKTSEYEKRLLEKYQQYGNENQKSSGKKDVKVAQSGNGMQGPSAHTVPGVQHIQGGLPSVQDRKLEMDEYEQKLLRKRTSYEASPLLLGKSGDDLQRKSSHQSSRQSSTPSVEIAHGIGYESRDSVKLSMLHGSGSGGMGGIGGETFPLISDSNVQPLESSQHDASMSSSLFPALGLEHHEDYKHHVHFQQGFPGNGPNDANANGLGGPGNYGAHRRSDTSNSDTSHGSNSGVKLPAVPFDVDLFNPTHNDGGHSSNNKYSGSLKGDTMDLQSISQQLERLQYQQVQLQTQFEIQQSQMNLMMIMEEDRHDQTSNNRRRRYGARSTTERDHNRLPESTHTLMIVHPVCSLPFVYGAGMITISVTCLSFVLVDLLGARSQGNVLGLPDYYVDPVVQGAQFLGIVIALFYEDEILTGLELLVASSDGAILVDNEMRFSVKRVVLSSVLRILIGIMYLICVFIAVIQSSDVLGVFYDVLALQFVENLDDMAYIVAKRGFLGQRLQVTTSRRHTFKRIAQQRHLARQTAGSGDASEAGGGRGSGLDRHSSAVSVISMNATLNSSTKKCASYIVRIVYYLIASMFVVGFGVVSIQQNQGKFRCQSFTVNFNEEIWEEAHVVIPDGAKEERLLMYPSFNGVYNENGTDRSGYPIYIEQNKQDGVQYKETVGAKIHYCTEIKAWVLSHEHIRTSLDEGAENECSWLARSPETRSYDLMAVTGSSWSLWVGEVRENSAFSAQCNQCTSSSDCNYHGQCLEGVCQCFDGYIGAQCSLNEPCLEVTNEMLSDRQELIVLKTTGVNSYAQVYGRPIYWVNHVQHPKSNFIYVKKRDKFDISYHVDVPPDEHNVPEHQHTIDFPFDDDDFFYYFYKNNPVDVEEQEGNEVDVTTDSTEGGNEDSTNTDAGEGEVSEIAEGQGQEHSHSSEEVSSGGYSVTLAYLGSRWFATLVPPDLAWEDYFSPEYHEFWSPIYSEQNTFMISEVTSESSPVGSMFFTMRRRWTSKKWAYGPFGILFNPYYFIEDANFFVCYAIFPTYAPTNAVTESPTISRSPSASHLPSLRPSVGPLFHITQESLSSSTSPADEESTNPGYVSVISPPSPAPFLSSSLIYTPTSNTSTPNQRIPSASPSINCLPTEVSVVFVNFSRGMGWSIRKQAPDGNSYAYFDSSFPATSSPNELHVEMLCLPEGNYEFQFVGGGSYLITSGDVTLASNDALGQNEIAYFDVTL